MKKVITAFLVIGLLLLLVGGFWYWDTEKKMGDSADTTIPSQQPISFERASLNGQLLLSTDTGLQLYAPETGVMSPLAEGFTKLTDTTEYFSEAGDTTFWLFMTRSDDQYHWYVVNWAEKVLHSLDEQLAGFSLAQDKIWHSVAWGAEHQVGAAFVAKERPEQAVQPFSLATFDLKSLEFLEVGVLSTSSFDSIGLGGTPQLFFARSTQDDKDVIVSKAAGTVQTPVVDAEGGSYLVAHNNHTLLQARYTEGAEVELVSLSDPTTVITTLAPASGKTIAGTIWWSSSGTVFALTQFSATAPDVNTISFYTSSGTPIFSQEVGRSPDVMLSADGTRAVLTSFQSDPTATDQTAVPQQILLDIYAGTAQAISFPEGTNRVIGVL